MNILLADDHAMIRQGLALILKGIYPSLTITECSTTNDTEEAILNNTYTVVITDLYMPGKPLIDVIKNLREKGNKTPIIVLSMSLPERNAVRVLKAGANAYITKDTAPEDLQKAIEFALLGKKYITPEIAHLLAETLTIDGDKSAASILSDREFQVLKLLAKGESISEIAENTQLSINTISTYKSRIIEKMQFKGIADLVKYAHNNDLI